MGNLIEDRDHVAHVLDGEDRVEKFSLATMMLPKGTEQSHSKRCRARPGPRRQQCMRHRPLRLRRWLT